MYLCYRTVPNRAAELDLLVKWVLLVEEWEARDEVEEKRADTPDVD